jgi:CheY-like chemotaxis protein
VIIALELNDMTMIASGVLSPPFGSVFRFFSPAAGVEDEHQPDRSKAAAPAAGPRVLVVDDETLIADSVAEILNRNGYDATALYSGADAIRRVEQECPDIVVTDVIMPDYDGVRLAMAIRARCPNTRIVLFSGNAATSRLLDHAVTDGFFFELLTKPVHPAQLLQALKS